MPEFFIRSLDASTIFLIAGLGELIGQRSGIINVGIEGVMLFGATAVFAQHKSGPATFALLLYPAPDGEEPPQADIGFVAATGGTDPVAVRVTLPDGNQRLLVGHEARQQQHRVAVTLRRARQPRQTPRQRRHLDERPRLDDLVQQAGPADVTVSLGHPDSDSR